MGRDCLNIGSTPYGEDCAQVGSENYTARARRECETFIRQLRRMFGPEPEGARLSIKSNPHDFGSYLEVVVWFDPGVKKTVNYAFDLEAKAPEEWDAEARKELGLAPQEA